MAKEFPRTRRIGEQLRRDLAELMRTEVRDARAALVSITEIEVSRDLAHAKVFVTYLGDAAERAAVMASLNQAAGRLRQLIGRDMHIRVIPKLVFTYDHTLERGSQLTALINAARASDVQRQREHGTAEQGDTPAESEQHLSDKGE